MQERYVEITFRKGKPLAAYVYLPRRVGVKSARTGQPRQVSWSTMRPAESQLGLRLPRRVR